MKIENQYCTPEQGQRLVELGIDPALACSFYFQGDVVFNDSAVWQDVHDALYFSFERFPSAVPAFSVAELGVMVGSYAMESSWTGNEAEHRTALLIDMLEQFALTAAEANERLRNA